MSKWSDLPLVSSSGAGHTIRGKYRVYGEGSVHHNGQPCEHGLGLDQHPIISRHDYNCFWDYVRAEVANWYFRRRMRRLIWPSHHDESTPRFAQFRPSPFDRPMDTLFGPPFRQVPTVRAGLRPEDSIYDRSEVDRA